ncbi:hypothetical protein NHX12_006489 [Muraenolepis orangiensis]|uniref:Uncharacterized protein n=1 Tax=Muraenolepis orangiensis TaxID=630683 RepID=A0A9Q0DTL9_9TELE|nr:hypothetical protein NHX12_006489 [Muraenolepis orangiensis]
MDRFQAGMVLGAAGEALGWRKGRWGTCASGRQIQEELASLGGLEAVTLDPELWPLGDSTLMHMTTAEALITDYWCLEDLYRELDWQVGHGGGLQATGYDPKGIVDDRINLLHMWASTPDWGAVFGSREHQGLCGDS